MENKRIMGSEYEKKAADYLKAAGFPINNNYTDNTKL